MARNRYGVQVPTSELRKLGITPLRISNIANRNKRKVANRQTRFERQVSSHENLTYTIGGQGARHWKGTVYVILTNKREAAKLAKGYGHGEVLFF